MWELKFGSWVLLRPRRINAYAQSVILTMRADEHESGGHGDPTFDTAQAIAVMLEKHGIACDLMHGFNWDWVNVE